MVPASSTPPGRSCGRRRACTPSRRSITFERATPKVALIVFTGYLPEPASAIARSVFLSRQVERLLEDLDFHRLAAQEALQLFEAADLGGGNYLRLASSSRDNILVFWK
jgi:hypothetical protein